MTFTYASTDPGATAKDYVRLRLRDTSSGSYVFEDEEITAIIASEGNKYVAAAVLAESLGAQYAGKADKAVGKLRISFAQSSNSFFSLASRLRLEANMRGAPYAGGLSEAEKSDDAQDSDLVQPSFEVGQFDYPGSVDEGVLD